MGGDQLPNTGVAETLEEIQSEQINLGAAKLISGGN